MAYVAPNEIINSYPKTVSDGATNTVISNVVHLEGSNRTNLAILVKTSAAANSTLVDLQHSPNGVDHWASVNTTDCRLTFTSATTQRMFVNPQNTNAKLYMPLLPFVRVVASTAASGTAEVDTITLPAFASITDRDYVIVYDTAGVSYAVYMDKTGTSIAPTGALYVGATYKVKCTINAGDNTATLVSNKFRTAINTLTGFTDAITTSGTATVICTQAITGPVTNPVPKNLDDTGAGSITVAETTPGVSVYATFTDVHIAYDQQ